MLKVRGGHRFEGYGNVKIATNHGTRAGWQLICYECQGLSDVIHRTGASFPPKVLTRLFSEKGWKVGNSSASDVCPKCLEQRRQRAREERKQYAKGNVDRLLDMIRQVDLMLASNVTIDYGPYQPQIAAQLKSLFETAYLCGMVPPVEGFADPVLPRPDGPSLILPDSNQDNESEADQTDYMVDLWNRLSEPDRLLFLMHADLQMAKPEPEPPPPEPPAAAPPPVPPTQEGERISPRTAAFLAEVRKQIFKGEAA